MSSQRRRFRHGSLEGFNKNLFQEFNIVICFPVSCEFLMTSNSFLYSLKLSMNLSIFLVTKPIQYLYKYYVNKRIEIITITADILIQRFFGDFCIFMNRSNKGTSCITKCGFKVINDIVVTTKIQCKFPIPFWWMLNRINK